MLVRMMIERLLSVWVVLVSVQGLQGQVPVDEVTGTSLKTSAKVTSDNRLHLTVPSRADAYYVLYRSSDLTFRGGGDPVAAALGNTGPLTFHPSKAVRGARYFRVAEIDFDSPGDIDDDGIDDLTELELAGASAPLNAASTIDLVDGALMIPDLETLNTLSVNANIPPDAPGDSVIVRNLVKFMASIPARGPGMLHFINTDTHQGHTGFVEATGMGCVPDSSCVRAEFSQYPNVQTAPGRFGLFVIRFDAGTISTDAVAVFDLVSANLPVAEGKVAVLDDHRLSARARGALREARIPLVTETDIDSREIYYLGLNEAEAYGRLRVMKPGERPSVQDIAIFTSVPNDVRHIAGIITEQEQTPLSHVNLRAKQNDSPNAFIREASTNDVIAPLIGKFVYLRVNRTGFEIREASQEEVDGFFSAIRPTEPQFPPRDLVVTEITDLDLIEFHDAPAFGVKSANLAEMRQISDEFASIVPDGFAIPFYFYDAFMNYNGLYDRARTVLREMASAESLEAREARLASFRRKIKDSSMPPWMFDALSELQSEFDDRVSIRCRSSTNNEDLPDFNGAGLYDSFTHHPHEGHLSKSIKQVYASLWNLRALEEREFYRIDHFTAAMGVLLHNNFTNEDSNGVAVSKDILLGTPSPSRTFQNAVVFVNPNAVIIDRNGDVIDQNGGVVDQNKIVIDFWDAEGGVPRTIDLIVSRNSPGSFLFLGGGPDVRGSRVNTYINAQFGENLVTNPEADAVPEQILFLYNNDEPTYLSTSNIDAGRTHVLSASQVETIATRLTSIHDHFDELYQGDDEFAMEIEFKITAERDLIIKQARPWVD